MTVKTILAGIPIGGAKVGVQAPDNTTKGDVVRLVHATIGPFVRKGMYYLGTDLGFSEDQANSVYERSSVKRRLSNRQVSVGEACAQGILTAIEYVNTLQSRGLARTVALEGFGRIGMPTARLLSSKGLRIVAVCNLAGTIVDPDGLDVADLVSLSTLPPDEILFTYLQNHANATLQAKEAINFVDADILIPGARAFTIDENIAERINAKIVCPISNAPVTIPGERVLTRRGILSVPDVISNAGALISSFAQNLGADSAQTYEIISEITKRNLCRVLGQMGRDLTPKEEACNLAYENLERIRNHEKLSSIALLLPWLKRLGTSGLIHGIEKYLSLSLGG